MVGVSGIEAIFKIQTNDFLIKNKNKISKKRKKT